MSLAPQIEVWLLTHAGWSSADMICVHFAIQERALRSIGETPGLVSQFAISGPLGYKHVRNATMVEWLTFRWRIIRHAISELRRVRHLTLIP